MSRLDPVRGLFAVAAAMALAGCVGPDFQPPAAPKVDGYTTAPLPAATASADVPAGKAQRFRPGRDIPADWWTLFGSAKLNALITLALKANPSVQAAQAALRVAHENVDAQRGAFFPTVQGGFDATRAKNASGSVSSASASTSPVYNLHTAQLSVSYTPDVWGGNWRQMESLEAQAEAQRFQLKAAQLTLASNVAAAAITEAGLRGQIAAVNDIVAIERQALGVLKRQNELGQVAEGDVVAQEAALAQAEQMLPPLQKQLAFQRDALAALVGRLPSRVPSATFDLSALHLPEDLPVSLPSRLVEPRPDILQAEANLHAASAEIGIAEANRLPLVNLTADMGSTASLLTGTDNGYSPAKIGLFTPGTGFWSLAGSVTQTLFDGFSLMHRQRAAEAAYDQAEAQYRATVLNAFQNVADTLHALEVDAEALKTAAAAEKSAAESLSITRRQLDLGAVGYLSLLTAQQAELQARINLVQAEASRHADTVALFQALGGGWWNRPGAAQDRGT